MVFVESTIWEYQEYLWILCKVPAHMGIKGNEEADKAAKEAIDVLGLTSTGLPYTDYYSTIRRARNSKWQRKWENNSSKLHYMKPSIEEWENVQNSFRLIWVGSILDTLG